MTLCVAVLKKFLSHKSRLNEAKVKNDPLDLGSPKMRSREKKIFQKDYSNFHFWVWTFHWPDWPLTLWGKPSINRVRPVQSSLLVEIL
jgi:hypothetical protein